MSRSRCILGLLLAAALSATSPALAQIKAVSLVHNLAYPIAVTQAPGDPDRLFILSQLGRVRILEGGSLLPTPFLDVSSEIIFTPEQGLLGMTFDPDYASNGRFYVFLSLGPGFGVSAVRRYTVSADPYVADAASAYTILELPQFAEGHKGGTITFGPDGYLWLAPGESNQQNLAQDRKSLLGKMLRIDVNGDDFPADSLRNYAIPPDNPFVGDPATADEIWALGLRNPWRFSFDRLTGDLWIGDVGQFAWEEIDFEPAGSGGGRNYGWPLMEGTHCYEPPGDCNDGSLTLPVHEWMHVICDACAGGYVYRGTALPADLRGDYFFSDYCRQAIWSLHYENGTVSGLTDWSTQLGVNAELQYPASWWQDEAGELYVVEYRAAVGEVWKIVPDPAYVGVQPAVVASGPLVGAPFPNPFRSATRFEIRPAPASPVKAHVYSATGRLVRELRAGAAGGASPLQLAWHGRDDHGRPLPAGVYFVRVASGGMEQTRRVVLLR